MILWWSIYYDECEDLENDILELIVV